MSDPSRKLPAPPQTGHPATTEPGSGNGAASAFAAMIRKRRSDPVTAGPAAPPGTVPPAPYPLPAVPAPDPDA